MAIEKAKNESAVKASEERAFNAAQKEASGEEEIVLSINRCSKVVKGGKNMRFAALVIVGDGKGKIGVATGKAKEVHWVMYILCIPLILYFIV